MRWPNLPATAGETQGGRQQDDLMARLNLLDRTADQLTTKRISSGVRA
jgi:hypothetical protein